MLRGWLGARNPLMIVYLGWTGVIGTLASLSIEAWLSGMAPLTDLVVIVALAALPLLPILGFHLHQARRVFRAGYTLADLRAALDLERTEHSALVHDAKLGGSHVVLRLLAFTSAGWLAVTLWTLLSEAWNTDNGSVVEVLAASAFTWRMLAPLCTTILLGFMSDTLSVSLVPAALSVLLRGGVRSTLWRSAVGSWVASILNAPER
ncbi:MAG: hypothetical protein IT353_19315 [Gemmatimonadaceae bacterium]|nr:hypothetical protein [Gemmatimonadaceae bacterium]